MNQTTLFLLVGLTISTNIYALRKNVTILVHGTGAGYKVKLGKSVRYCPEGLNHIQPGVDIGSYYLNKYSFFRYFSFF